MLSNYKDRPLPSQIYQMLQPYERNIMMLEPFQFMSQGDSRKNSFKKSFPL